MLVTIYLIYPVVATLILSITESGGFFRNYGFLFTDPSMFAVFRNNLIWLVVGTLGSVGLGLLIAGLVDRVRYESMAKTVIFLPLAISLVGASVIWAFVYTWRPPGEPQYGLLNAVWTALGGQPVAWVQTAPVNTFALIVIKGSIITVAITVAIAVLKIFDIVYVMTGGRFDTDVIANQMFLQMFQFGDFGRASALAVILFLAVIPLMIINLRGMRGRGLAA